MKSLLSIFLLAALASPGAHAAPTPEQAAASLARDLAAHFQTDGSLQIELIGTWTPPADAPSDASLVVMDYPARLSSTMGLRCRLGAESFNVLVRASVWRDAWTTRTPLPNGSPLDPAVLGVRRVDTLVDRDAVPASTDLHTLIAVRQVPAESVLAWFDVAPRPLVRKGELVDVVAQDGALTVTLKAVALQTGGQGDLVAVRNPESLREVSGRVVGPDCIEVAF